MVIGGETAPPQKPRVKPVCSWRLPLWIAEAVKVQASAQGMKEPEFVTILLGEQLRKLGYKSPEDLLKEKVGKGTDKQETIQPESNARAVG